MSIYAIGQEFYVLILCDDITSVITIAWTNQQSAFALENYFFKNESVAAVRHTYFV